MIMRILKYPLQIVDSQTLLIPHHSDARLLAVQDGVLCLWLEVRDDWAKRPHTLRLVGTGHDISDLMNYEHVGSVVMPPFVWHAYLSEQPLPAEKQ